MEIKKPLAPADVGVWRIYQQLNPNDYTGCVFDVKSKRLAKARQLIRTRGPTAKSNRLELTATDIEIFHDPRSSSATVTELTCAVPYEMDYCYLSGPTAGDYAPQRFDRLKTLGLCRFVVTNITSGVWACGINDLDGAEDHLTYYNVSVYQQPGRAVTEQLTASSGDREQRLLCRTILDLPIDICRFVDPSGEVHGVSNQIKPSTDARYRYYGKGLREGECGLEIVELQDKDFGRWKCAFKVRGREYEISMDIVEEGEVMLVSPSSCSLYVGFWRYTLRVTLNVNSFALREQSGMPFHRLLTFLPCFFFICAAMSVGAIIGISIAATIGLGIIGIFAYRKLNRRYTGPTYTVSSSMANVSTASHQS